MLPSSPAIILLLLLAVKWRQGLVGSIPFGSTYRRLACPSTLPLDPEILSQKLELHLRVISCNSNHDPNTHRSKRPLCPAMPR